MKEVSHNLRWGGGGEGGVWFAASHQGGELCSEVPRTQERQRVRTRPTSPPHKGDFRAQPGPKPVSWDLCCPWLSPLSDPSTSSVTWKSSLPLLSTPVGTLSISGWRYCKGSCLFPLPPSEAWPHLGPSLQLLKWPFQSLLTIPTSLFGCAISQVFRSPPCPCAPWGSRLLESSVCVLLTVYLNA